MAGCVTVSGGRLIVAVTVSVTTEVTVMLLGLTCGGSATEL